MVEPKKHDEPTMGPTVAAIGSGMEPRCILLLKLIGELQMVACEGCPTVIDDN